MDIEYAIEYTNKQLIEISETKGVNSIDYKDCFSRLESLKRAKENKKEIIKRHYLSQLK
jgi:hypothetical protein